ncbi:MAG: agmatinase [Candidatus Nitrospinota bacterium M3_3B_026]
MSVFDENMKWTGFGGLKPPEPSLDGAAAVVLPVPYDSTTCYRSGTRGGPRAIIEASAQVELYDPEWGVDLEGLDVVLLPEVEQEVSGPEAMVKRVETVYRAVSEKVPFVLTIGGEHSVSAAAVRVLAERFKGALTVVQIDAHADLRDSYQGSPASHACVMRRISEHAPIVQAGIRNASREEAEFIRTSGHPVYHAWDIAGRTDWIGGMIEHLEENVYITIDLDGFDPSVVPGVGTPEPGGLGWRETVEAIRGIGRERKIVGADVMELLPVPGSVVSDFTAARLCFKLLAAAALSPR